MINKFDIRFLNDQKGDKIDFNSLRILNNQHFTALFEKDDESIISIYTSYSRRSKEVI